MDLIGMTRRDLQTFSRRGRASVAQRAKHGIAGGRATTMRMLLLASTALSAVMPLRTAEAGSPVWNGTVSSDWFTAGNWNTSAVPNATDTVTIDLASPNATVINGGAATALSTFVGAAGTGSLTISNGGSLTNGIAALGFLANSIGTVTVTGAGSTWTNTGNLSIGRVGSGTLNILAGGNVTAVNAYLGDLTSGAKGKVTVSGAGSSFTTSGQLLVGNVGAGTLSITNGGLVTSTGGAGVGGNGTGTVTVDGAGSSWSISSLLGIGGTGGNGTVTVSNGGSISSASGGVGFTGTGTMTVTGPGSSWVSSGPIVVGYANGSNGILIIANGGTVTAPSLTLGSLSGSIGALYIGSLIASTPTAPGTLNVPVVQFGAGIANAIDFNHTSSNYVFAPQIAGAGVVNQFAGYTVLTANNTYTGPTEVFGGTLAVAGSIASSSDVLVETGGTLAGTGTVAATSVLDGILAPGMGGSGTLNMQGNLLLTAAATYLVQISGSSSTSTAVTGKAQIAGALLSVVPISHVSATTTYTILTASSGVSGTFASVLLSNSGLARDPRVTYTGNSVLLTVDPGLLSPSLPTGSNVNQRNVAAGIDTALSAGANPSGGFNALLGATGTNLNNALTQASGEAATAVQQTTFDAMDRFVGTLLDPFGHLGAVAPSGAAPLAYADTGATKRSGAERDAYAAITGKAPLAAQPVMARWNVWAAGYGGAQTADGNATLGSHTTSSHGFGVAAGADYRVSPDLIAGFALGGGGTSFGLDSGLGGGRTDLFQAGAFARRSFGQAYLAGALAYGFQDVTLDRNVAIAGVDHLQSRFNANALSARLEAGRRYDLPGVALTPYAAGQVTALFLPG